MGPKPEHIGMIEIDPNNSNNIYGCTWSIMERRWRKRIIFSNNGGEDWKLISKTDEHTGVNLVHLDQEIHRLESTPSKRRHVFTYIGGGLGSKI